MAYKSGNIMISNITGNIQINVQTEQKPPINQFNSATTTYNVRLGTSNGGDRTVPGCLATDYITVGLQNPYYIKISGVTLVAQQGWGFSVQVCYYNSDNSFIGSYYPTEIGNNAPYLINIYDENNSNYSIATKVRIVLSLKNGENINSDDTTNLVIDFIPKD